MLCLSWGTPAIYWERRTRRSSGDCSRRYMQLPELTSTRVFAKLLRREPSSRNARQRQPCLPVNAELAWSHWQHAEKRNTRRDAAFWSGKRLSTTTNHRSRILETSHLFIYNENRTKVHNENYINERYKKDTRQSYETHKRSRIKSTSLLLKPGISACLLFMRSISLIVEQCTFIWVKTLRHTKFLLIDVSLCKDKSKRIQHT